jgi:hypothetical protein
MITIIGTELLASGNITTKVYLDGVEAVVKSYNLSEIVL